MVHTMCGTDPRHGGQSQIQCKATHHVKGKKPEQYCQCFRRLSVVTESVE